MHIYSFGQWVLLFFFYAFCGWVWESCYVSLCRHRWVNRGFLEGPLLPIYGFGAILILFATLPVEESLPLTWLLGMLAATLLEYITGAAMERIFTVRYWDYSGQKWNLHGHICLKSSIAWGFFSILLVRLLHPPVGRLLRAVPSFLVDPCACLLTIGATVDAVRSVQDALDLKDVLTHLTKGNEDLRRLARRAEVAAAFAEDDLRRFRQRTAVDTVIFRTYLWSEHQARRAEAKQRLDLLEDRLEQWLADRQDALSALAEALELGRPEDLNDLKAALHRLRSRESQLRHHASRTFRRTNRILRSNPSAAAKEFKDALEILRSLDGKRD